MVTVGARPRARPGSLFVGLSLLTSFGPTHVNRTEGEGNKRRRERRDKRRTDNKTMNPGTWNPRSYCRYGPALAPTLRSFFSLRSLIPYGHYASAARSEPCERYAIRLAPPSAPRRKGRYATLRGRVVSRDATRGSLSGVTPPIPLRNGMGPVRHGTDRGVSPERDTHPCLTRREGHGTGEWT